MGTGDTTLFGKAEDNECPVCQELKRYGNDVEIIELEEKGQYCFPEYRMRINYCPVCGRELKSN